MKRNRFIKINREMIKTVKFSSIEEFRCYFMMQVEKDIFSKEGFDKSKIFEEEFKEVVFRSKKNVSNERLNIYIENINSNCFSFDISKGFVKLYQEDLMKFKSLNQLYAFISIKWGSDISYIDKQVFYNWFDVSSKKRAQTVSKAFKDIGFPDAKYELKNNKVIIYKNYNNLIKNESINTNNIISMEDILLKNIASKCRIEEISPPDYIPTFEETPEDEVDLDALTKMVNGLVAGKDEA